MKDRSADDVLSFTFNHLERVLNGEIVDHDGFISRTAMLAEKECKRLNRKDMERDSNAKRKR
jgi:hypothetical protein